MRRTILWMCLGVVIAAMPLAAAGCAAQLAGVIVKAPNAGVTLDELQAMPEVELGREPEQRFRVTVGPPLASLAVRVLDPASSPMLGVRAEPSAERAGRYRFHLVYASQQQAETEPRGTVIVLHGLFGNKDSLPAIWARIFAGAGYRAVLVDMRGHGRSTGSQISYGVRESRDLVQLLDALEDRDLLVGPVGVFGISFGGSTAIQLAGLDDRVAAVIALAPFANMRQAVSDFGRAVLGPVGPLLPEGMIQSAVSATRARTGIDPASSDTAAALASTRAAVLLIHGRGDRHVPVGHSLALRQAMQGPGHLIVLPDEDHMTLTATPSPALVDIRREALAWFEAWLSDDAIDAMPRRWIVTGGGE